MMFEAQGPNGERLTIDAPDEQSAQAAIAEMGQAPQKQAGMFDDLIPQKQSAGMFDDLIPQTSRRDQFAIAFDPSSDDPATAQGLGDKLDENGFAQTAANSFFMGYGDEIMGTLAGGLTWAQGRGFDEGYDKMTGAIRGDIDRYAERHPVKAAMADVAGAVPTALIPGGAAVRGAGLATKVARGVIAGAGYGAARGFGEGEGGVEQRAESAAHGAALGGLVGGAVPVAGRAIGKAAGRVMGRRAAPTVEAVKAEANTFYNTARQAGVAIKPDAMKRVDSAISVKLQAEGFRKSNAPQTFKAMKEIRSLVDSGAPVDLEDLHVAAKVMRKASESGDKSNREAARLALRSLDMWMEKLKPAEMLNGSVTGREAIQLLNEGKRLWATQAKGATLEAIVQKAQTAANKAPPLQQKSTFAKKLRDGVADLVGNPEKTRGFTEGEIKALKDVAKGGNMGWLLGAIDTLAPKATLGHTAQNTVWGTAAVLGGPVGQAAAIGASAAGIAARGARNASSRAAGRRAQAIVRSGGVDPFDAQAAKAVEGYANQLIGTGGQASAPLALPSR